MKKNSRRLPRLVEKHDTTIFLSSLWTSKDKIPTNSTTNEFVNIHADKLNPGGILMIQTEVWKSTKDELFKIDVVAVCSRKKKKEMKWNEIVKRKRRTN